jgi:hypothetical protein
MSPSFFETPISIPDGEADLDALVLGGSFPEQDLPHERQRQASLHDERVMEVAERAPFLGAKVVAKSLDFELAERVVEVCGVIGAPPCLFIGVRRLLNADFRSPKNN